MILWNEILEFSKEKKRSVILITDDKKEDWWQEVKGRKLGARCELVTEFRKYTQQLFHLYVPEQFLKWASEYGKQTITEQALEEVRELQVTPPQKDVAIVEQPKSPGAVLNTLMAYRNSLHRQLDLARMFQRKQRPATAQQTSEKERELLQEIEAVERSIETVEVLFSP